MLLKDALGRYGEHLAARYLIDSGFEILDKNWRCARGEIDIVAADGSTLVICEVKTRSSNGFGTPLESVVPAKAARLRELAVRWLSAHPGHWQSVRFDVVGVLKAADRPVQIRHLRGAF